MSGTAPGMTIEENMALAGSKGGWLSHVSKKEKEQENKMKKQSKKTTQEKIKNQKISWLAKAVYAAAAILAVAPTANAMHIMEGYLPPVFCIAWGIVCLPF